MTEIINKCCVPYCANGSHNKSDINFYEFPNPPDFTTDPVLHKIISRRKKLWIRAVQIQLRDINDFAKKRICSEHFVSGKSADIWDIANIDWIPNKNMPYKYNRNFNLKNKIKNGSELDSKTDESSSIYSEDIKEFIDKVQRTAIESSSKTILTPRRIRHSRGDFKNETDISKTIQQWEKKLLVKEPKKNTQTERKTKNIFTANYNKPIKLKIPTNGREFIGKNMIYPKHYNDLKDTVKIKDVKNPTQDKKFELIENDDNGKTNKECNVKSFKSNNIKEIIHNKYDNDKTKLNQNKQNVLVKKDEIIKSMNNKSKVNNLVGKLKNLNENIFTKAQNELKYQNGKLNKDFINLMNQQKTFTNNNNVNAKTNNFIISKVVQKRNINNEDKTINSIKKQNILTEKFILKSDNIIKSKNDMHYIKRPDSILIKKPLINNKKNNPTNSFLVINDKFKLNKAINKHILNTNINKNLNRNNKQINIKVTSQNNSMLLNNKSKITATAPKFFNQNYAIVKEAIPLKLEKNVKNNKVNLKKDINNNSLKDPIVSKKKSKLNIGKFTKTIKESVKGSHTKNRNTMVLPNLQDNKNNMLINKNINLKVKQERNNDIENTKNDRKTVFDFMHMI